jgi:hypothetical protein
VGIKPAPRPHSQGLRARLILWSFNTWRYNPEGRRRQARLTAGRPRRAAWDWRRRRRFGRCRRRLGCRAGILAAAAGSPALRVLLCLRRGSKPATAGLGVPSPASTRPSPPCRLRRGSRRRVLLPARPGHPRPATAGLGVLWRTRITESGFGAALAALRIRLRPWPPARSPADTRPM